MAEATIQASEVEQLTCHSCGNGFTRRRRRGPKPRRCADCAPPGTRPGRARSIQNRQAAAREAAKVESGQRTFECQFCHLTFVAARVGKKPKSCQSCRRPRENRQRRLSSDARYLTIIYCRDCGAKVEIYWYWSRGKLRCDGCQAVKNREVRRHSRNRRRAVMASRASERFTDQEIFERDGYKCGICSKKIKKTLAYPHPMCASLDHTIPMALGGGHVRANVKASHLSCNLKKRTRLLPHGEQLMLIG